MNLTKLLAVAATLLVVVSIINLTATSKTHKSDSSKVEATVMITRLDERSGGSGVVIESSDSESKILTNSHVCGVVENGGIVKNSKYKGFVTSYTRSSIHDLCLITVSVNFHTSTRLASESADHISTAAVSGFPRLMPNIITRGSFGNHVIASVMTGIKPCTEEDITKGDPSTNAICMFLGGFPIIRTYDAQFIGATIQAGNSGSGVFNENGELSGLVFAGSGDFGYGMIVPFEYLYNFLNVEIKSGNLVTLKPETTFQINAAALNGNLKFKKGCESLAAGNERLTFLSKLCNSVSFDMIYTK